MDQGNEVQRVIYEELHRFHALLRNQSNPFGLPDTRFLELFRLTKRQAGYLCSEIIPQLSFSDKWNAISPELKIFAALGFYASGSYQRQLGQSYLYCMSQQSIGRAIKEVTECIYDSLVGKWIKFPRTIAEKNILSDMFLPLIGFPGVIGAIDCTHINILSPPNEENIYVDRRGNHSKNTQIVCDTKMRIYSITARHAGSTHDSFIWQDSMVKTEMERCWYRGEEYHLIGDSGYAVQPWLLTPFFRPIPDSPEDRYSIAHRRARCVVECCNGDLKGRFRCLLGERTLRYSPEFVGKLTTVCAALHNICLTENPEVIEVANAFEAPNQNFVPYGRDRVREEGLRMRDDIVVTYFN